MSGKSKLSNQTSRRRFVSIVPFALLGGICTSIGGVVARFLQPVAAVSQLKVDEGWRAVDQVENLQGDGPIRRSVKIEEVAGWSTTSREHVVYVLPQNDHRVMLAACPHEQCPVFWDLTERNFLCPCHDSRFSETGERMSGPANENLTQVSSTIVDGVLRIRI